MFHRDDGESEYSPSLWPHHTATICPKQLLDILSNKYIPERCKEALSYEKRSILVKAEIDESVLKECKGGGVCVVMGIP